MTLFERVKKILKGQPAREDMCLTRCCLKNYHKFCDGTVTYVMWLPSRPCECECHKD